MRFLRYGILGLVLGGLTLVLIEGSRPAAPVALVPTQYGSNLPTGIGASIYPTQTLFINGQAASGLGVGPLVGIVIGSLVVLGALGALLMYFLRRG